MLAFFRVWFFLVIAFHILVMISYVGAKTREEGAMGFQYYANWFRKDQSDLRNHAILSIFASISGLLTFKVVLQLWLFGMRVFKDIWLVMGVFCRLMWHIFFFGLFLLVWASPMERAFDGINGLASNGTYLSRGYIFALIYSTPVLLSALLRMCCTNAVWSTRILNSLDGTRRQYIGRDMGQPYDKWMIYVLSWGTIYFLKFIFTLELMIKPLAGPSLELLSNDRSNLLFVIALWAPVVFVYIYDVQIWFTLYQSIVGLVSGLRQKMGSYTSVKKMKYALYTAPEQFDKSVASKRMQTPPQTKDSMSDKSRLKRQRFRFATIWNEVINSFRVNDLLDDRETTILQYRVLHRGQEVQNPIFLLVGKINAAVQLASKARSGSWTTDELMKKIYGAGALDGVQDGLRLTRDVFYQLLGNETNEKGPLSVLEYLYSVTDFVGQLNLKHLPALMDAIADLLTAILVIPEDLSALESTSVEAQYARLAFHEQTHVVIDHVHAVFKTVALVLNDRQKSTQLEDCPFLHITPDLQYQKDILLTLYKAEANAETSLLRHYNGLDSRSESSMEGSSTLAQEDFISGCIRLLFLLRLDVATSQPRCEEARRRLSFFLHSMTMDMPSVTSLDAMPSFSVMTPYYSETVLFTLDELKNAVSSNPLFEKIDSEYKDNGRNDLTIMGFLITFHAEEWTNFMERVGVSTLEEAVIQYPDQVRLWASLRGQTLARTVYGMMMYEDTLLLLRWLELSNDESMSEHDKELDMSRLSALKFSYITGCQIYSKQVKENNHRAKDIDYLMKRFPSWRVSFVDAVTEGTTTRYDCVLVKSEGDEIVEVYRYELPGDPILGEGKPENQNVALPFTRGEYLQTIDMNQEHYFEETIKMPNFLATAAATGEDVTIIGMKEHVFTGRASSLARFMTLQELVFVTLTQRVLANPLRARMHYGHPDVFEKSFVMTNGGVSKASRGINLSEDVFSGYNVTLRGGLVTHVEFMQCGKGRDVTLSQINAFEAKLSNGCAESCLSRDGHRMSNHLDFFRLNSMFFGHFGFYICNALTVLCVYIYAYSKLYVATHSNVIEKAASNTAQIDTLSTVIGTQYILQFGMLTTLPLLSTLIVEYGWKQALFQITELFTALGVVFYVFLTGTKAHFYDVALIRGGSKYRGTGRGFAITRDPMVNFFKEYNVSHFRKAVELIGVMILFGIYGQFDIGAGALTKYCTENKLDCRNSTDLLKVPANITSLDAFSRTPQSYGVASFAVLLLGACWLMAPFLFNTDGLVLEKTLIDVSNWFAWMMRVSCESESTDDAKNKNGGTPKDGWIDWYRSDVDLMLNVGPMGRLTYMIREFRLVLAMYFVFVTKFSNKDLWILIAFVFGTWYLFWMIGCLAQRTYGWNQKHIPLLLRGIGCMVFGLGGIFIVPLLIGAIAKWSFLKSISLSASTLIGLNAICQYSVALHGAFGIPIAMKSPFVTLGLLNDMIVGLFLVIPLLLLSFLPFMRILQTRMLYNGGFSRALSSGSEVAASICILIGLLGGYVYGFMSCFVLNLGYVNHRSDGFIGASFQTFLNKMKTEGISNPQLLMDWASNGQLKAVSALAGVVATLMSLLLAKIIGRRMNMSLGCILIIVGMVLNLINSGSIIILASCIIIFGCSLLAVNYLLYAFEVSAIAWRGKSVSMFIIGGAIGFAVHSIIHYNWNQSSLRQFSGNEWRLLPFYSVAPIALIFVVVMWFIPESPVWYFTKGDDIKTKEVLVRLLRRQNVALDIARLESELNEPHERRNYWFRVAFMSVLQTLLAFLTSNSLIKRNNTSTSSAMVYYGVTVALGVSFSLFIVDNVRRKTILKDFLPITSLVSLICAVIDSASNNKSAASLNGLLALMFIICGMSLMTVTWLTSLEMFGVRNRAVFFSLSMACFYMVEAVLFYTTPSFATCHFIFGTSCGVLTIIIFCFCASTKQGAIQIKSEKKKQKEEAVSLNADEDGSRPLTMHTATYRQMRSQKSRMLKSRQSFGQIRTTPDVTGNTRVNPPPMNTLHLTMTPSPKQGDENDITVPYLLRDQSSFSSYSLNEDDFDGDSENMMEGILLHPLTKSVSFLESRTFPDAQIHAETRGRGVRL